VVVQKDLCLSCGYDFYFRLSLTEKLECNFACGYGHVGGPRPVKGTFPSARVTHLATTVEEGTRAVREKENGMQNVAVYDDHPHEGKVYDP
jgi:hypothetical protein